jgi:hypothetical protein
MQLNTKVLGCNGNVIVQLASKPNDFILQTISTEWINAKCSCLPVCRNVEIPELKLQHFQSFASKSILEVWRFNKLYE